MCAGQFFFEHRLDGFVPDIAVRECAFGHLLDNVGVSPGKPQYRLGLAQVPHGVLLEDRVDELRGMGTVFCGLFSAPRRRRHEVSELVGRIVRMVRHEGPRQRCPGVHFYPLMVGEDLYRFIRSLDPDLLPIYRVGRE